MKKLYTIFTIAGFIIGVLITILLSIPERLSAAYILITFLPSFFMLIGSIISSKVKNVIAHIAIFSITIITILVFAFSTSAVLLVDSATTEITDPNQCEDLLENMELIIAASFIFVSILGVIFHFTHKWFRNGLILHMFSAVNESTWEHMKLAFSPMFIVAILQSLYFSDSRIYWTTIFISMMLAIFLIPILYYPIKKAVGREILAISISLYFVCIALAFITEYIILRNNIYLLPEIHGQIGIIVLLIIFLIFTYKPPKSILFRDPISNKYGDSH